MSDKYPGMIEADCMACATAELAKHGDFFAAMRKGFFIGHPSIYSKCGNKRCPCAAHHDNVCTGSNEPGQPGSLYPGPIPRVLQARTDTRNG